MKCGNLRAYLDNELGRLGRVSMRLHLRRCNMCRGNLAAWSAIDRCLKQLGEEPEPTRLAEKVTADAVSAATAVRASSTSPSLRRTRIQGVVTMRRGLVAVGLVAVLMAVGLGIVPANKGNAVLAQVAEAMARVENAHLVGWAGSGNNGERRTIEVWLEGATKYALVIDGRKESADNGEVSAELRDVGGRPLVTIRPSGSKPLVDGVSVLSLLEGKEEALESWLKNFDAEVTGWRTTKTSSGGQQITAEITRRNGNRMLLNIDPATNLLSGWSELDAEGNVSNAMEHIEYNVQMDDSVFDMEILQDAIVDDQTVSAPDPQIKANRKAIGQKLEATGAHCWFGDIPSGGSGKVDIESGYLVFQSMDKDGEWVYQMPGSSTFRVLGKALVYTSDGNGKPDGRINEVVEDAEITAPDSVSPPRPMESLTQGLNDVSKERFRLQQKLSAKGAQLVGCGSSGSFGANHKGLFFEPKDGDNQVYFLFFPDRNVYRVIGRAEVRYRALRGGFTRIVENGEIKGPGKPDKVDEPSNQ